MLKNPNLQQIADKYGVSVPQLGIRYLLQLGALPLPKTLSEDHMRHNATVDFTISDDDMALLSRLRLMIMVNLVASQFSGAR